MKKVNKIICLFFALIICLLCFPVSVFAGVANPMHSTYVCDDLRNMGYTDYATEYPVDSSDDNVYIMDFTEYGYDANGDQRYYGIYIYVYNPSGRPIQTNGNNLEMSYINILNSQTKYSKYALFPLSYSSDGYNDHVYYKFVVVSSSDFVNDIRKGVRSYSVSSLEIKYDGSVGAKPESFAVGGTYIFQGYQKNFGIRDTDVDTLYRTYEQFDVCEIELYPASWFSNTASLCGEKHVTGCKCEDYRWEVSSVYFSIPNYFIEKYGDIADKPSEGGTSGLYSVSGEYTKKVINGILTDNSIVYDELLPWADYLIGKGIYEEGIIGFYDERCVDGNAPLYSLTYPLCYNLRTTSNWEGVSYYSIHAKESIPRLVNVLKYSSTTLTEKIYLSSDTFLQYYNAQGRNGKTTTENLASYNQYRFLNLGYQTYEIKADGKSLNELMPSFASSSGKSWLFKLFNRNLYSAEDFSVECKPIVEISDSDVGFLSNADNLFVMEDDFLNLQSFYTEKDSGNHVYLMRFDVNPYYAPQVSFTRDNEIGKDAFATGYYFEKAIYEDFDILQFTFRDANANFHTVPVSCSPIDIVGSVIPGNNNITDNNGNPQQNIFQKLADGEVDWFSLAKLVIALLVVMFLIWLAWRVFGGMIIGVTELGIKASDSRMRRRQQKIDSYETEKKIKADKEKKREERKIKKDIRRKKDDN